MRGKKAVPVEIGAKLRAALTFGGGEHPPKGIAIDDGNGKIQVPNVDFRIFRRLKWSKPEVHHLQLGGQEAQVGLQRFRIVLA
ncbi:hypothetical protein sS8_2356 [Methylocaldum marinum]|uniref:Uncharacterized protein n=1 Tax=Methylocaldum marinum TaxID=1432792 RepID=A0A250KRP4_9GAMM|nr:hypothetical protein [Methylocaldum marinum]BBA34308.1 hypothetical protein sS8_2356 [Methylocaldum marinum]